MSWWSDVGDFMVDMIPAAAGILGGIVAGPAGAAAGYGLGNALSDIGSGVESYLNKEAAKDQLKNEQNFNAEQAQINRDFQREERLQTQQFNQMMWEKNNEYNSPAAQLQRAQAAGINPNLVVSSLGRSTANPVTSSPMSGSAASSSGSLASAMLLQSAQIANLNAQTRKANADANLSEQDYAYNNVTFSDRVEALKYANEETKARLNKIVGDTKLQEQLYEFLAHKNEEELKAMRQLFVKTSVEIQNLKKQGNMIDKQIEGASISNSLADLQLQFSKTSGIPQGVGVSEVIWKTMLNGNAGELVDLFIQNVEDYAKHRTVKTIKDAYGFSERQTVRTLKGVYNLGKKGIDAIGSGLGRTLLGVTLPKSIFNP